MADNSISQDLSPINANGFNYVERNGQILFSTEEIGKQLGYSKPSKSINILFNRNQNELQGYAVGIKLMSTDGKYYEVRHFSEEGVYILSMLANTPKARDFRSMLAALLRKIREDRLELAREAGYQQGRDETLALPAMQAERKKGYLAGMKEGKRLARRADRLTALEKLAGYLQRGFSYREAGKMVGLSANAVQKRIARARLLGFWPENLQAREAA